MTLTSKIIKYICTGIFLLGSLLCIWFLVNNLQPLKPALYSFAVIFIIGVCLCINIFAKNPLKNMKKHIKVFLVYVYSYKFFTPLAILAVVLIAILTRLYFYLSFSYTPISDPITFYEAGLKLAAGSGMAGNDFVTFLPYLAAYDNLLGLSMRIISDPWLATIFLNTILDIAGAAITYILVKKIVKRPSYLPLIAFSIWLLNPLNIVFSVISLPLIAVNFFIVTTILITYLLIDKLSALKTKSTLFFAVLLGFTMGYGNCFRPVFVIMLIALGMLLLYVLLSSGRSRKLLLLVCSSFLLVMIIFTGIQKINVALISGETGQTAASNPSGWSIYVGSNWSSGGSWNLDDQNRISVICKDSFKQKDFDKCHEELKEAGIARYKDYGLGKTLNLLIQKLYLLSSSQNYMYNAEQSIDGYATSKTSKIINIYSTVYILLLFIFSAKFLYKQSEGLRRGKTINPIILFTTICMLGFFLSIIFVEAAPRYASVLYPAFIVFATLSFRSRSSR